MSARFTVDGSPALETHLARICANAVEGILTLIPETKLEAIFLAGGYGRGEGGVLKTESGDLPYNDIEFYVCIHGIDALNQKRFGTKIHCLAGELSEDAGIEVEFKIASLAKIRRSQPSMFLYDLAVQHRTVFGEDHVLEKQQFRDATQIPIHEATRLLMNRCSGLLFAKEQLQRSHFTSENADFVGRNQAKAQLALGDVVLTSEGQYHWSCRERNRRLQRLGESHGTPFMRSIVCHHNVGVEFKLHPQKKTGPREMFEPLQAELCALACQLWLQLESSRLGQKFASPLEYAFNATDKCPETSSLRNRLVNTRRFGVGDLLRPKASHYPRERLLNSLPLLLWNPEVLTDKATLQKVQNELRTEATDFSALVSAYHSIWQHFN